jgi:hypothetical protein
VRFNVIPGDATTVSGDVLVLKYAQAPFGLDKHVGALLEQTGIPSTQVRPSMGDVSLLAAPPGVSATEVLFVGVEPLGAFGYEQIRVFARRALAFLATERAATRTILVTSHGAGYGLDENEAFESQLAGFLDALEAGDAPQALDEITFVERHRDRAERLAKALSTLGPLQPNVGESLAESTSPATRERLSDVGYASLEKPHIFVAMPYVESMNDLYHYGIQNAATHARLLCERADLSAFTGDVMEWVRTRIRTSQLVVADLTGANANVYLEVGYAWGCGVPTVLLVQYGDDLKFDVRGQRCLIYTSIRNLEEQLSAELSTLSAAVSTPE